MARITPPVSTRGLYEVQSPYTISPNIAYTTVAVRKFESIENNGISVFDTYYANVGLAESVYTDDLNIGATIVTLVSDFGEYVHIPDTYISKYPDITAPAYQEVILSVTLGPIKYGQDLTGIKTEISDLVTTNMGVATPTVNEHVIPLRQALSQTEADALETARLAAVSNATTERAKRIRAEADLTIANQRLATITQYLVDNNLVPPP